MQDFVIALLLRTYLHVVIMKDNYVKRLDSVSCIIVIICILIINYFLSLLLSLLF